MNTVVPCVTCEMVHDDFDCIAALKKGLRRTQYLAEQYRDSAERWRVLATNSDRIIERCASIADEMGKPDVAIAIRAGKIAP